MEMIDMMEELEEEEAPKPPVKLIVLKNGTYLISYVQEVVADYGMPNCRLITPYQIVKDVISPFPKYTDQEEIMMSSDSFLTICDPSSMMEDMYIKTLSE